MIYEFRPAVFYDALLNRFLWGSPARFENCLSQNGYTLRGISLQLVSFKLTLTS